MIPELQPVESLLFINADAHEHKQYPTETDAGELLELPRFTPKLPWVMVIAARPKRVIAGNFGREKVPVNYQKWIFDVKLPYLERWPDILNTDGTGEFPFALLQKIDVIKAYIFLGRIVGVHVEFAEDYWQGQIAMHVTRLKQLMDRVV